MVGYDAGRKTQLRPWEHSVAGAVSGCFTRATTQPLDVLKIRFQLKVEENPGLLRSVYTIATQEGVSAFWKGHIPAQLLTQIFVITEFTTFELSTQAVWRVSPSEGQSHKTAVHFLCGCLSGSVATIMSHPVDILRTRLVAQGNNPMYGSMREAVKMMVRQEGPLSLFKGLSANLIQTVPATGLHFGCYSFYKSVWATLGGSNTSLSGSAAAGALSGLTSKAIVYPFDVAKKRLQVVGFAEGRKEFGATRDEGRLLPCMSRMLKEEGVRSFYKGASWALLKALVVTSIQFSAYEKCCTAMRQVSTT